MKNISLDLAVSILANMIAAVILGLLALVVVSLYRRRGIKRFFGFSPGRLSDMRIYLSSIAVNRSGTQGTAGISEGFYGDAITEVEYRHALRFVTSITNRPASWLITTILGARAGTDRVVSSIVKSPSYRTYARKNDVVIYDGESIQARLTEHPCIVLVGSPIYNILTHHALRPRETGSQMQRMFEFIREHNPPASPIRGIRFLGDHEKVDHIRTEGETIKDFFIVQKVTVGETKIFICAGTCTAATAAALGKLTEWRFYAKKFSDQDFGCLYKIFLPGQQNNPDSRETDPDEATAIEFVAQLPTEGAVDR